MHSVDQSLLVDCVMYMACIYVDIFRTPQSALNFVTLGNTHHKYF